MKAAIRQHFRQLRRSISLEEKNNSSHNLSEIFIQHFQIQQKNIAVYLAQDGEIDLHDLIEHLWKSENNIFLPVVRSTTLQFARYFSSTMFKKNHYKIDEPEDNIFIAPENLDMVLMPLVAFDKVGARLGMGKGFYDQAFAFCCEPHIKPKLIGAAYSCQLYDKLPVDSWDVPLDGVLTERELWLFNRET